MSTRNSSYYFNIRSTIPPTSSEIEAMPASSRVSTSLTELTVPRSCDWVAIVKSAVPVLLMPWRWSSVDVISAVTVSMASWLVAERPMAETLVLVV